MENRNERYGKYRYLPFLSLLLLAAIAALGLRLHLMRPPADLRRKLASFRSALELIPEHYEDVDRDRLFEAAMRAVIESLDDPYSRYLTPSQLRQADAEVEGRFGGVGIQVSSANGEAVIVELMPEGAAQQTDLSPGDIIVNVNGREVETMSFQELISSIRGRPGTTVSLTVRRPETGEKSSDELERRLLDLAPVQWEFLPDGIALVQFRRFSVRSVADLREVLEEIRDEDGAKALILDLRDNPGGLLSAAVQIADMFLTGGRIVGMKSTKDGAEEETYATESTLFDPELPMVVLVNERSASASELLAGALQGRGRATVIGTNTVGKGVVDSLFSLPDGSGLVLKVADYTVGDDIAVEGKGIEPDIPAGELPPPPDTPGMEEIREWLQLSRQARAEQKQRAVEFLKEKRDGQ